MVSSSVIETNPYLHEVVITAIIYKQDKFLIIKRSKNKKRFPSKWTVPGGKLETKDYLNLPKESEDYWYNVLEKTLAREVKEEVGLEVEDVEYVTSLATIHKDGSPSLVISSMAKYKSGEIVLQTEEAEEFAWVSLSEAKTYDLLDGIYEELEVANNKLSGQKSKWNR